MASRAVPPTPPPSPATDGRELAPVAVRAQILATEHWSLLATRSMTWSEVFSRTTMQFTVFSAAMVALALVAQTSDSAVDLRPFAMAVLALVLLIGVLTQLRVNNASSEDRALVMGMNRLRAAYLEIAPELRPYFITSSYDDEDGVIQTYSMGEGRRVSQVVASAGIFIALVNSAIAALLAGVVGHTLGGSTAVSVTVGLVAFVAYLAVSVLLGAQQYLRVRRVVSPRFPSGHAPSPAETEAAGPASRDDHGGQRGEQPRQVRRR